MCVYLATFKVPSIPETYSHLQVPSLGNFHLTALGSQNVQLSIWEHMTGPLGRGAPSLRVWPEGGRGLELGLPRATLAHPESPLEAVCSLLQGEFQPRQLPCGVMSPPSGQEVLLRRDTKGQL